MSAQTTGDGLRLSDDERERASAALGEHFAQGRLDADEHAERHERIWTAKTRGEIPPVFADLPGGSPLHQAARPAAPVMSPAWTTPPRVSTYHRRSSIPLPVKVLALVALVVLIAQAWPLVFVALGVFWLLSLRGRSRRRGYGMPPMSRMHGCHGGRW